MIDNYGIPPTAKKISDRKILALVNDPRTLFDNCVTNFSDGTTAFSYTFDDGVVIFEREQVIDGKYLRKGFIAKPTVRRQTGYSSVDGRC